MRAVACQQGALEVVELPEPEPGPGQVRIEVARCGICGSDLHARHGIDQLADVALGVGYDRFGRSDHRSSSDTSSAVESPSMGRSAKGTWYRRAGRALPLLRGQNGVDATGLSQHAPGAYAEQLLVQESMMMAVPNGLDPTVAALTEPMAVALHAVRRGEVGKRDVAIVIGCGPIGLGTILMLKATGVRTVIASDFSPGRRALAERCGADVVIDPAEDSPYEPREDPGWLSKAEDVSTSRSTHARNSAACRSAGGTSGVWRRSSAPGRSTPSSSSASGFRV